MNICARLLRTNGAGLFCRISSISAKISGVSFGKTSIALRFSMTCSGFEAPRMTVEVLGWRATQARARAAVVVPSPAKDVSYFCTRI